MFSLRNKKTLSLNYPQYPILYGALVDKMKGTSIIFNICLAQFLNYPSGFYIPTCQNTAGEMADLAVGL